MWVQVGDTSGYKWVQVGSNSLAVQQVRQGLFGDKCRTYPGFVWCVDVCKLLLDILFLCSSFSPFLLSLPHPSPLLPPTSHPPQNTTITVTLVPVNDNAPTLTSPPTPLTYDENNPGLIVLPNISVSDIDNTECNPTSLSVALVTLETATSDVPNETLGVRNISSQCCFSEGFTFLVWL